MLIMAGSSAELEDEGLSSDLFKMENPNWLSGAMDCIISNVHSWKSESSPPPPNYPDDYSSNSNNWWAVAFSPFTLYRLMQSMKSVNIW